MYVGGMLLLALALSLFGSLVLLLIVMQLLLVVMLLVAALLPSHLTPQVSSPLSSWIPSPIDLQVTIRRPGPGLTPVQIPTATSLVNVLGPLWGELLTGQLMDVIL